MNFEGGGGLGLSLTACLDGLIVREGETVGAAAALRDLIDSLVVQLGLTVQQAEAALNELVNLSIPTDPSVIFNPGAIPFLNTLPLPPQVRTFLQNPAALLPSDLGSLVPSCANPPSGPLGDLIRDACGEIGGNIGLRALGVIDDIDTALGLLRQELEAAKNNINA